MSTDALRVAFEEAVQFRLFAIKALVLKGSLLPIDPPDQTVLMIAVNTEAHVRYWREVYEGR